MHIKMDAYDPYLDESLKAKTKDPLWFLVKQWHTGEFLAESCGHPVTTEIRYAELPVTSVIQGNGAEEAYEAKYPAEFYVEKGEEGAGKPPNWDVSKLEYTSSLAGAGFKLTADGYYSGNLEWYDYILQDYGVAFGNGRPADTAPSNIGYSGMPSMRYWEADEATMNFRQIERKAENVLTTMLLDFSMLYGEDWYMLPLEQSVGTLRKVTGIKIKDSFDETRSLPAVQNKQQVLDQWSMFSMTGAKGAAPDNSVFFLPNSINELLEGKPIEEVSFVRDEFMNLVWAVENKYQENGRVVDRNDERSGESAAPAVYDKVPVYIETAEAPENWTPYFPVMLSGSQRVILLRGKAELGGSGPQQSYKGKLIAESKSFNQDEVSSLTVSLRRKYKMMNIGRDETWDLMQSSQGDWALVKSGPAASELLLWCAREKKPAQKVDLQEFLFDVVE